MVKKTDMMHIVPGGGHVGLACLEQQNAASDLIDSIWLVNNYLHVDTNWTAN